MSAPIGLQLPIGQWVDLDGKLLRYLRRGRDRERRMIFEGLDGVPEDLSDGELLALQFGAERRLKLLLPAEASDRLETAGKARVSLDRVSSELCNETRRRLEYVKAWERAGCPSRTETALGPVVRNLFEQRREERVSPPEMKPPSPRHVLRWIAEWIRSGGDVESLVPQTANRGNGRDRLHPRARQLLSETVEEYYLVDTRPPVTAVYAQVRVAFANYNEPLAGEDRLQVPSRAAVYDEVRRIDRYTLDCTRLGRRTADQNYRPVMSSPQAVRHNEVWEIDHTRLDVVVIDEKSGLPIGRPWITAVIDRHTRVIPGFHIGFDPPGTYPVMECLRQAIMPGKDPADPGFFGTPEVVVPDQGKEFKGASFVDGLLRLGIGIQYAPVLKAWYKGRIERFFRTLATDVLHRVPGTTFSNIFDKGEVIPEMIAVVTLGELCGHITRYLAENYHLRRHRGLDRRSPKEVWDESVRKHGMRPLPNPERLAMALAKVDFRVPQRYGIQFEGLIYNSPDVAAYRSRPDGHKAVRVTVDPDDLTTIGFLDPKLGKNVRVPILPHLRERMKGVTLQKHKLARALQRANQVKLAGNDGLFRAYALIDESMRKLTGASGAKNRVKAASYWAKLTRPTPPEEARAFSTPSAEGNVSDGLFPDEAFDPAADTTTDAVNSSVLKGTTPTATIAEARPCSPETPKKRGRPKGKDRDADPPSGAQDSKSTDEYDDLLGDADALGMTVTHAEGE